MDSRSPCREEGVRPHERREPERWRISLEAQPQAVHETAESLAEVESSDKAEAEWKAVEGMVEG